MKYWQKPSKNLSLSQVFDAQIPERGNQRKNEQINKSINKLRKVLW